MKDYIHFYGTDDSELFALERQAMDRQGKVIAFLDRTLPRGRIMDIGAGNGYTASYLLSNRNIVCVEPSETLPDFTKPLTWVKATAETLPFHHGYFDAAYATWAYFLPGVDKSIGLRVATNCIRQGGQLIIVDNAGEDEFTSFANDPITSDFAWYADNGFDAHFIDTSFEFDCLDDAERLMSTFFGRETMRGQIRQSYTFRVVAYVKEIHHFASQRDGTQDTFGAGDQ